MDSTHYLETENPIFPDPRQALDEVGGLLAIGGNLSPETLLTAYCSGIFPWFEDDQPLLWWSPPIRAVISPTSLHISRSLKKSMAKEYWSATSDQCFAEVIHNCATLRKDSTGTWITEDMEAAYNELHLQGVAHSVEIWKEGELVGGLYGLAIGGVFCGESMFSLSSNSSKIALTTLSNTLFLNGFDLIDCQLESNHLTSMGAFALPRDKFLQQLKISQNKHPLWPKTWELNKL